MRKKDREILTFLIDDQKVCDLVDENNYTDLYKYIRTLLMKQKWEYWEYIGLFTDFLYASDIDPLAYLDVIPMHYLTSRSKIKNLVIPGNVTEIGQEAFSGSNLESFALNGRISGIKSNAFIYCKKLKTIDLSKGGSFYIDEDAFNLCNNLEEIILPWNVDTIHEYVFSEIYGNTTIIDDYEVHEKLVIKYLGSMDRWNKKQKYYPAKELSNGKKVIPTTIRPGESNNYLFIEFAK